LTYAIHSKSSQGGVNMTYILSKQTLREVEI